QDQDQDRDTAINTSEPGAAAAAAAVVAADIAARSPVAVPVPVPVRIPVPVPVVSTVAAVPLAAGHEINSNINIGLVGLSRESALSELSAMGYPIRSLNEALLEENGGDLLAVIADL